MGLRRIGRRAMVSGLAASVAGLVAVGCAGAGRVRRPSEHSAKPGRGIRSRGERMADELAEREPPPEFQPPIERVIGRVALVHEAGEFVLIEAPGAPRLEAGTELEVRAAGGDRRGVRVSPERRPGFLVADFESGEAPGVGDVVVLVIRRGGPTLDAAPGGGPLDLPPLEPLPALDRLPAGPPPSVDAWSPPSMDPAP